VPQARIIEERSERLVLPCPADPRDWRIGTGGLEVGEDDAPDMAAQSRGRWATDTPKPSRKKTQGTALSSEAAELSPQNAYIRRLQHQLAERANLVSRSGGREPDRRVRIAGSPGSDRRVRLCPDAARTWR
jgi:hypothetical protein